ncbi:MAG: hypothetical protein HY319_27160 [Armatimonadetes bacterium]|nr:hypothetical protein [Armatimonadota bacterium]
MGQITCPRIIFIDAGGEERATVWARGDIKLAGRSLSQDEMFLRQLEEDSGASFMPRARSYYDVPDLKIDDFKRSRNRVSLPAGLYVFTTAEVVWEAEVDGEIVTVAGTIPVLERRDTNLAIGEAGAGTIRELWYDKTVYESLAAGGAANIHFQDDGRDLKGQIPVHAVDPNGFLLAESGTSKKGTKAFMTASLAASSVSLYGDATVVVDGDFGVTAWNGSVPSLSLGDADGRTDTSTAVEAKGSISIYGPVTGTGKLLAAKTVVFAPTAATLEAEIDEEGEDTDVDVSRRAEGLAVYAGETVHLWTPDLNGSEAGLGYAPGAVSFKGLIYAKQGFGFDSADQPLYIEGALVAGNGGINANRAPVVQFVYNEEYVEDVLNDLPEDRIHLERFVWKE